MPNLSRNLAGIAVCPRFVTVVRLITTSFLCYHIAIHIYNRLLSKNICFFNFLHLKNQLYLIGVIPNAQHHQRIIQTVAQKVQAGRPRQQVLYC